MEATSRRALPDLPRSNEHDAGKATYDLETALAGAKVVVTGGAGLIGSRITARLRSLGAKPVALCTLDAYPREVYEGLFGIEVGGPHLVIGDVTDSALVREIVADCDFLIHAAALADVAACTRQPSSAISTNVLGTQSVLDAVAGAADRVQRTVFVSSASVYGHGCEPQTPEARAFHSALEAVYGPLPPVFDEQVTPLDPVSAYANTKAWGEAQTALTLDAVGVSHSTVRYFSVYGEPQVVKPRSHSWVVAWFATRAALGLPLELNGGGRQVRDFVHVDDVAEATVRALVAPDAHRATFNVGTGIPTSIREVAELVRQHFPETVVRETPMPPGDPMGGFAAVKRMRQVLKWRPEVCVADGVDRYAQWIKETPAAIPTWLRESAAAS
ncbi:NAD-dependent epimerase/dehydratase family protein [Streptomyces platensis]|uniref:NAD-dependent epimerase/dehydratase family protein n=1 Tax=Streptomyces platensis TaxID=58346 RepID=UPI001F35079F|nr:NAD(P)-dependent oxidoreductase [Streptomyces platensis]MCF3143778.1 NAD(P)-dependent oxidoreductase [Streptomyces platensis]